MRAQRFTALVACLFLLAACAEAPQRAAAPSAPATDPSVARAIARHQQLAAQYRKSGDLARAAAQWQALVLLDPDNREFRNALSEVRSAISRTAEEQLASGNAALRAGDTERASAAMLRVLAADPSNADAMRALREIDRQRATRVQSERASRAARADPSMAAVVPAPGARQAEPVDSYDLEQRIEMFRAGDIQGGLRELRRFVDAHPGDRVARTQIGTVVFEKGRESEAAGAREDALMFYEQASALRGERVNEWTARADMLRRSLGDEYYDKGVAAWGSDKSQAVRLWETSLRFDPRNAKSQARLAEARRTIGKGGTTTAIPAPR